MTMDNVRKLMRRYKEDKELRDALYAAKDAEAREQVLRDSNLHFTDAEFLEMENVLHVQCETMEEAEEFFDFRHWWGLLRMS